jgi:hypothetical protein
MNPSWDLLAYDKKLNQYNCRMIPLFDQGYHYINTRVT